MWFDNCIYSQYTVFCKHKRYLITTVFMSADYMLLEHENCNVFQFYKNEGSLNWSQSFPSFALFELSSQYFTTSAWTFRWRLQNSLFGWRERLLRCFFKSPEKHLWSVTFSKVALLHGCFSRFLDCTNGSKLRKISHIIDSHTIAP